MHLNKKKTHISQSEMGWDNLPCNGVSCKSTYNISQVDVMHKEHLKVQNGQVKLWQVKEQ